MRILGISGSFSPGSGDAAAVLLENGNILGACEEERFTRIKHGRFCIPEKAISYLLNSNKLSLGDIDILACNVNTYEGFQENLKRFLKLQFHSLPRKIVASNHHLAHAASAYWGSGFSETAVLTYDYSGDGLCGGLYYGKRNQIHTLETISTQCGKSLGKYYAAFTQYLGFERGDEYKVMGLAGYGDPRKHYDFDSILNVSQDDYHINPKLFFERSFDSPQQHVFNEGYLDDLGLPRRKPGTPITEDHKNLALTVQYWFEKAILALAHRIKKKTGAKNLALAGGCALNSAGNGALQRSNLFENIFIPSVASDAGTALGAAYLASIEAGESVAPLITSYLGPGFDNSEIHLWLKRLQVKGTYIEEISESAAKDVASNKLVGWFQGRSEYGPRALGARSILANPGDPHMKDKINLQIKFRESFRPFAPSVTLNQAEEYFENACPSPFMNLVFNVSDADRIPAVTHVDGTARVQTVANDPFHKTFFDLLVSVERHTGMPIVLNTSFNINGQPIVNNPHEAIYTFYSSGLDVLYLGNYRLTK